jgi:ABC-type dipeptide/oligopeptide/nickel transport system permease subunit
MMRRGDQSSWIRRHLMSLGGAGAALLLICVCLAAPGLAPFDPAAVDLSLGLQPPSADHWLGTDELGRDVLSRLLWGGRVSITVAVVVLLVSLTGGVLVGLSSGYWGGLADELGMRLTDFIYALPGIILALALIGALGPSIPALILALSLSGWVRYARLARSLVLTVKSSEFVLAAQAVGATDNHIMRKHLLPALLGPVAVQLSLDAGATVLAIAGLSFLGLGIQPPTPEWGTMLVDARPFMDYAPHLVLPPGLAIFILVFGSNAFSEGLEDWLRP